MKIFKAFQPSTSDSQRAHRFFFPIIESESELLSSNQQAIKVRDKIM